MGRSMPLAHMLAHLRLAFSMPPGFRVRWYSLPWASLRSLLCGHGASGGTRHFTFSLWTGRSAAGSGDLCNLLDLGRFGQTYMGVESYFVWQPYALFGYIEFGGLPYQVYDLLMVALAIVLGFGLWFWLERSRMGRMTTAVVADREISAAMGINVSRVFAVTFAIGTVFVVIGGVVTAPKIAVTPGIGLEVIILAFAVVVIGGLGSIPGAAIGALLAGYARAMCVHLAPQYELFAIYAVMAVVLAIKPHGLFARASGRKI